MLFDNDICTCNIAHGMKQCSDYGAHKRVVRVWGSGGLKHPEGTLE
jgi:hypothetical protein